MSKPALPWRLLLLLVIATVAVPVLVCFPLFKGSLGEFIDWLRATGPRGMVLIVGIYILAAALLLPSWPLTWSAGFVFGIVPGTIVASIGGTLGAIAGFVCGRYLARDFVQRRLAHHPVAKALETAVDENGFKIVALTRLSPAFPYNVINYAYGTTQMPLRTYTLATWLGMLPATVVHVYLGAAIKNVNDLLSGEYEGGTAAKCMLVLSVVATIVATVVITRAARRALRAALPVDIRRAEK